MKKNKLAIALEKLTGYFYNHYALIGSQILSEMIENDLDDPELKEFINLLSQDKKDVTEQLQKSLAINNVFYKMRNDFVEDFLANIKDIYHQQEDEKRAQEKMKNEDLKSIISNDKIKELMLQLKLSYKQKQTLKNILDQK